MLDDVVRVGDHAGDDGLALGQPDALPEVVLVLLEGVGRLERVGPRIDLQHVGQHLGQRRLVDARPLVDAVAGVQPHLLGRDAAQGVVDRLDVEPRPRLLLSFVEIRLDEDVGEEGLVHLQHEAGVDDGEVFHPQRLGDREQVVLLGGVVGVVGHAAGRHRGHEGAGRGAAGQRGTQVGEVRRERRFASVAHRAHAEHRGHRRHPAAAHGLGEIAFVVLGEGVDLGGELARPLAGPGLEALEPLLHVGEEAGLRLLAVGDDVEPDLELPVDDVGHGPRNQGVVGRRVVQAAASFAFMASSRGRGRGRLPMWVVRIRSGMRRSCAVFRRQGRGARA